MYSLYGIFLIKSIKKLHYVLFFYTYHEYKFQEFKS